MVETTNKAKQRINISGWSDEDTRALEIVHANLKQKGLTMERDGKPNASAILLYLLKQEARKVGNK